MLYFVIALIMRMSMKGTSFVPEIKIVGEE